MQVCKLTTQWSSDEKAIKIKIIEIDKKLFYVYLCVNETHRYCVGIEQEKLIHQLIQYNNVFKYNKMRYTCQKKKLYQQF